ncbi:MULTISPECIES: aldo/keto reductase [unclassified Devosia]|uniref:aldo/keto reductase n=1 Tax=unclassified Devosia TaxID=196773 RepID=UPI000AE57D55|nr:MULTISPECIES: aldo/keto reductase [unclassified Devosia]
MTMPTRTLGKTGYGVSAIGLGCWQLGGDFGPVGDETARDILRTARSLDVNFWDTADVYGGGQSESRIGAFTDKKGVLVATKLGRGPEFEGMTRYTRERVKQSLAGSIGRLGVETLDLAQLHCIPIEVLRDGEIFTWLDDMRAAGMIRHWGASVQTVEEGMLALRADTCTALQTIFNLFRQDAIDSLFPAAQKANAGIIVRLPLASGLLSGRMSASTTFTAQDHRSYNRDGQAFYVGETFSGLPFERGVAFADEIKHWLPAGMSLAHLALRFILDQPAVSTVIAGVTRPAQLEDNVAAAAMEPLEAPLVARLRDFYLEKVRPEVRGGI